MWESILDTIVSGESKDKLVHDDKDRVITKKACQRPVKGRPFLEYNRELIIYCRKGN
jgi:hypothetical protein